MSFDATTTIYLFNIFTLLVIGGMLMFIKTAPELRRLMYHRAKWFLVSAVIIVAVGQTMMLIDDMAGNEIGIFPVFILLVASFQACLFTFLVLILFHSRYVTTRNILKHMLPTAIFIVAYIITILFRKDVEVFTLSDYIVHIGNPALLLRTAFVVTYGIQLAIYISIFNRERKLHIQQIDEYFFDTSQLKLRWGTSLFYQAVAIGIVVLIFSVKPTRTGDILLTLFLPVFYGAFAVRYINFQHTLPLVMQAVEQDETHKKQHNGKMENTDSISDEELCRKLESLLVNESFYLVQGIVIANVATKLKVNKRTLSAYINSVYDKNFNWWINSLRIEHAKRVIDSNPELALTEVAYQSGFADSAMLCKEFKRHIGVPPSVYRKTLSKE